MVDQASPALLTARGDRAGWWNSAWRDLLVLFLFSLICAPFFNTQVNTQLPAVRDGVLTIPAGQRLDLPTSLRGDWQFSWIAPQSLVTDVPKVMRVPGRWDGSRTSLPSKGRARYEMTIRGLAPGQYRLIIPPIHTASEVWIDGRLASARGTLANDAASTTYNWRAHDVPFTVTGDEVQIRVELAAFLMRSNGMSVAPTIGSADAMQDWNQLRWGQEFLFQVSLLLVCFFNLAVYLFRTRDMSSLYVSAAAALFMPSSMMAGHDNMLLLLFPNLGFAAMVGMVNIMGCGALVAFTAYAQSLYPSEGSRTAYRVVLAIGFALAIVQIITVFGFGVGVSSEVNAFSLPAILIAFLYVGWILVQALVRRRDGAMTFLIGMAGLAANIIIVGLVEYEVVPPDKIGGFNFITFGVLIMIFAQIIVLARRWSQTLSGMERVNDDLRQLLDVNLAVTSEMQLESLLAKIVRVTTQVLHADRSSFLIFEPETQELRSIVAEGVDGEELRFAADTGIAGEVLSTGRTLNVADAYADPRFNRELDRITGYRTKSMLSMPVTARDGRRIGVMQALNRTSPGPFDKNDSDRMAAFAAQAAVAIDNATLFREVVSSRNANESILRSMSSGVMTLDRKGRLLKLNDACCRIMEVEADDAGAVDWWGFAVKQNEWIVPELTVVGETGVSRTLHDIEIKTVPGNKVSANVSVVPLRGEEGNEGWLIIIDDISEGKRLGAALRRFMPDQVAAEVLERRDDLLFGSACTASILFADIRNFTSLAETLDPRATVDVLNEVFTDLFEAVSEHGGVLDKFIGDAIMAVYGAPLSGEQDAENAVASALRMQSMICLINERRTGRGQTALKLGIGIATGEVVAGTVGSPKRMDYTVIGDSVNLAARLEQLTKSYPASIIICEATAAAVQGKFTLKQVDEIQVRGRSQLARIFAVTA